MEMTGAAHSNDVIDVLIRCVDDDWQSEAAHERLLSNCSDPSQLARVAAAYRGWSSDPERAAVASRQLDRLAALAMARLDGMRSNRRPKTDSNLGKYILLALLLLGSVVLLRFV